MHTKVVYQAAKALRAHRLRGAALQLPRRRRERRRVRRRPRREGRLPRRARLHAASAIPACRSGPAGMSFGSWIALTVGADDPRVSTLLGIAPPVARYDFERGARPARKPKFFIHGESRRAVPAQGDARVLRASRRSRRNWSSSTRADHLFDGKTSEVGDAVEDLLADFDTVDWSHHAGRRHRFRRSHGGRQGAERHAARHAARRARRRRRSPRRCAARPGIDPAEIDDVILGCAMPEAEQGLNVARIASLRAGIPVTASAVTVNRFCSSGLQAIAYAAERIMCGFGVGDRRRRHRVDEPGADGRQQDLAEPDARRRAIPTST